MTWLPFADAGLGEAADGVARLVFAVAVLSLATVAGVALVRSSKRWAIASVALALLYVLLLLLAV